MTMLPVGIGALCSSPVRHDPYFANVSLLCHADGTNGQTTFTNVVYPTRGSTILATTATVTISNPLFGTGSANFPGSSELTSASHADYNFGSGAWSIELALRTGSPSQTAILYETRSSGSQILPVIYISGGQFFFYINGVNVISSAASAVATNTWQRIGVFKVGSTTRMFLDGTQSGSDYADTNTYTQTGIIFGHSFVSISTQSLTGQMDEMRVTKGVGRHSVNYTVDAAAFPDS